MIVNYPLVVLLGCVMLLLGFSLAGIFLGPLPDFSDPLLVSLSLSRAHGCVHTPNWDMVACNI